MSKLLVTDGSGGYIRIPPKIKRLDKDGETVVLDGPALLELLAEKIDPDVRPITGITNDD